MKLAIGTNDKETLPKRPFGESRYFCVVNLLNAQRFTDDCRVNAVPEHDISGKRLRIVEELEDCDALVGRSFGAGILRNAAKMRAQIILTTLGRIDEVVHALQDGSLSQFRQFDPRKRKFVPMEE
jgi:predicted Fe-Mo cluster-binding NifX family protein